MFLELSVLGFEVGQICGSAYISFPHASCLEVVCEHDLNEQP